MSSGDYRDEIADILAKALEGSGFAKQGILPLIERPELREDYGDYSFPCFALAGIFKKAPQEIAVELAAKVPAKGVVSRVSAVGPYLNFFVDFRKLSADVLGSILEFGDKFGSSPSNGLRVVIEYPSPNTNKPLHLGHVRNMLLGQSLSRILSFAGFRVFQVNLNNDRGVHICKAMLAYERFSEKKVPDRKPDHFVGDLYVLYGEKVKEHPELEQEVQEMLKKWEAGDKATLRLWKKLNTWALRGFAETYKTFGIKFDRVYNESEHYQDGRQIVLDAFKKGILKKDEKGNIVAGLKEFGLPDKILLRADGTSIYITQDINLARLKYADFKMDKSIYVVGSEQALHFRQLFKVLEMLKVYTGGLFHLAHGMVYLTEGRMKSREGRVVDADDLVAEMVGVAEGEVKKRHKLSEADVKKRAVQIGLGAVRFFILKYDPLRDFTFHPEESISFEGETGPYIQYAHARICSVLAKYGKRLPSSADFSLLKSWPERRIVMLLSRFPETVEAAASGYKPLAVARYLLELSQAFNHFYDTSGKILEEGASQKAAHLLLIAGVRQVLRNGLALLVIDAPERM